MESLQRLFWLSDYCSLRLFHMGINDITGGDLESIKYDTYSSGVMVKGIRAHLVSLQPCWSTMVGFSFYEHGMLFED